MLYLGAGADAQTNECIELHAVVLNFANLSENAEFQHRNNLIDHLAAQLR
jgi:hypothetical protein